MAYSHITFTQLKTALANRLGDTGNVYWTDTECGLYLIEALRTWGLASWYWRDSGTLSTSSGVGFYNINTLQNTSLDPLLSYTVTDQEVSTLIQYHLLEPATGSTWTGSEQFTLTDVTDSLQRRRDRFLVETGCVLTSFTQALGAGAQTVDLPDTTLVARNMHWTAASGTDWPIMIDDIGGQRNYGPSFLTTQGVPLTASTLSAQPLRYVLAPPTNEPGTLRVLASQSGAVLTAGGIALGVPDDTAWVIKWGALADMLGKEGPAQDLPRAYFCERRWQLGIELSRTMSVVMNAQINGVDLSTDSLANLDLYNPNWYSSTGIPTMVASEANYIALSRAPNGIYSVLLDVVRKAIVPTVGTDHIQIGREYLDVIVDYAEHLAAFKCGGMEHRQTDRAAERFFDAAILHRQRLAAQNPALTPIVRQSLRDYYVEPMMKDAPGQQILADASQSLQQ